MSDDDFTYREDLKRAGGMDIRLAQNASGTHVRYSLLLRDMPFWRDWGVSALTLKCYDDPEGTITICETPWMEKEKKNDG